MIKKSLAPLALGGFGIGMTEFVMMGILPDIATGLDISIPQAGYLISAYAVGVVVGAPTLVSMLSHRPPRSVLIWFMLMFTAFNALSAFAPNFHTMLLFRFLAGLPHGAFFGVGAVVATRLADKGKEAAALASMFSGLTLANVLGVPAGTPTTFASVRPENMLARAAASLPLSARRVATTAPTPKNAPCGRPARKRNSSIVWKFGANADSALNAVNISMNQISTLRGGRCDSMLTSVGAPTTTPTA